MALALTRSASTGLFRRCVFGLLLWCCSAWQVSLAQDSVVPEGGQLTRFQHTVRYLQDGPAELRGDFATMALSHLARAYFSEAKLAREEARQAGSHANLRAWSVMVERYASQMPLLLEDIEFGFPVELILGGEKSLIITVAERTVILSPPRLAEQKTFEQAILTEFCAWHRCEQFLPAEGGGESIAAITAQVRPNWAFSKHESVCAYRGITVRFKTKLNMANARTICEQFLQEVVMLTDELAWQHRHAVAIEWDQLDIQSTPDRPEHMVRINALGDTVLVTVPLLYGNLSLRNKVLPWVRRQVTVQEELNVELDADLYGWQKR